MKRVILCLALVTRCTSSGNGKGKNIVKYIFRYSILANTFLKSVDFLRSRTNYKIDHETFGHDDWSSKYNKEIHDTANV